MLKNDVFFLQRERGNKPSFLGVDSQNNSFISVTLHKHKHLYSIYIRPYIVVTNIKNNTKRVVYSL